LYFSRFPPVPTLSLPFALTGALDPRVTFSRPSLATMYDSTGRLTFAPNNLSLNSQNFSGANWPASNISRTIGQSDPFGGTNATLGTFTSNGGDGLSQNILGLPSDRSHIVSIYARFGTWRWFEFTTVSGLATRSWVDLQNGVAGTSNHSNFTVAPAGNGFVRISAKVQGAGEFYFTPRDGNGIGGAATTNNGATFFVYGFQAEAVTYETVPRTYNATTTAAYYGPRFDYNPNTLDARGLLIEEARTNICNYSNDIANAAWTKLNGTVTNGQATGPDGTLSMALFASTGGETRILPTKSALTGSLSYTYSIVASYINANARYLWFRNFFDARDTCFDLQLATAVTVPAGATTSIQILGGGLFRYSVSSTLPATPASVDQFLWTQSNSATNPSSGTVGGQCYVGYAQIEQGSFATSYIPTVAAAVARSADIATMTGTNFSNWYNQGQGTFVYEAAQSATGATTALAGSTYVDGTNASATLHYFNNTASNAQLTSYSPSSAIQVDMSTGIPNLVQGVYRKAAFAYAIDNFAVVATGTSVAQDNSALLAAPVVFSIGSQRGALGFMNGWISSLVYYNTRLPNAALQSLTGLFPNSLFYAGEQGVWYDPSDLSTLFQDSSGTTPVTAVEQPVGLMLDKSKSLLAVSVGSNPLDISPWSVYLTGTRTANSVTGIGGDGLALTVVAGRWYKITANTLSRTGNWSYVAEGVGTNYGALPASGPSTLFFRATSGTLLVYCTAAGTVTFNSLLVQEIPGNHATQATSAARPTLSARVNLLTKTEQFDDAAWTKFTATVTANTNVAPDGTTTADTVASNGVSGTPGFTQVVTISSITDYIARLYVLKTSGATRFPSSSLYFAGGGTAREWGCVLNTNTGVAYPASGWADGAPTTTVTSVGDYWLLSMQQGSLTGNTTAQAFFSPGVNTTGNSGTRGVTTTGSNVVWGADLRPANDTALPAYQRVNTATDYNAAGFPYYLQFDGVDDSMATASINFTATAQMSVFAGVRKLSDVGLANIIAELSDATTNNRYSMGGFLTPSTRYFTSSGGTLVSGNELTNAAFSTPISNVLTGLADISSDLNQLRINGVLQASSTADQGTGNYPNAPLYIGRRAGATFQFNGRIYSLIVRGAATSEALVTQTERWISNEMGGGYVP
jgi:hypothetical protein